MEYFLARKQLSRMVLITVGRMHSGTLTTCGHDKGPHVTEASGVRERKLDWVQTTRARVWGFEGMNWG